MSESGTAAAAFARQRAAMAVEDVTCPEKAVLLVLAIMANADGAAWPSITQLAARASIGRRTAFEVLDKLTAAGLVVRDAQPGKGATYTLRLNWCAGRTSADAAPVREAHSTGAGAAPKQPGTTIGKKRRARAADCYPRPEGVEAAPWRDFLANQARKRHPNTATAHKRLLADLARYGDAEWTPGRLVEHAAARGWAGIYDPRKETGGDGAGGRTRGAGGGGLRVPGRTRPSICCDAPRPATVPAAVLATVAELGLRFRPTSGADLEAHAGRLALLARDLADAPAELLAAAAGDWARASRFMPTAAELVEAMQSRLDAGWRDAAAVADTYNARLAGVGGRRDVRWVGSGAELRLAVDRKRSS